MTHQTKSADWAFLMTMHMAVWPRHTELPKEKGWVVNSWAGVTMTDLLAQTPVPCSVLHTYPERSLSSRKHHLFHGKYILNPNLAGPIDWFLFNCHLCEFNSDCAWNFCLLSTYQESRNRNEKSVRETGLSFSLKSEKKNHIKLNTFLFFSHWQTWIRTKLPAKKSGLEDKKGARAWFLWHWVGRVEGEARADQLSSHLEYTAFSSPDFSTCRVGMGIHVTLK